MPKFGSGGDVLTCSFCGKRQDQVVKLIAGPGVYICDECVDLCTEIIEEGAGEPPPRRRPTDDDIEAAAREVNDALGRLRRLALQRQPPPQQPPPR